MHGSPELLDAVLQGEVLLFLGADDHHFKQGIVWPEFLVTFKQAVLGQDVDHDVGVSLVVKRSRSVRGHGRVGLEVEPVDRVSAPAFHEDRACQRWSFYAFKAGAVAHGAVAGIGRLATLRGGLLLCIAVVALPVPGLFTVGVAVFVGGITTIAVRFRTVTVTAPVSPVSVITISRLTVTIAVATTITISKRHLTHLLLVNFQLLITSRKIIQRQQMSNDIHISLFIQRTRIIIRHLRTRVIKQIPHRIETALQSTTSQLRITATSTILTMTGRTTSALILSPRLSLLLRIPPLSFLSACPRISIPAVTFTVIPRVSMSSSTVRAVGL